MEPDAAEAIEQLRSELEAVSRRLAQLEERSLSTVVALPALESMEESPGEREQDYYEYVLNLARRYGGENTRRLIDGPLSVEPEPDDKFGLLLHQTLQDEVYRTRRERLALTGLVPEEVADGSPADELLRQLATLSAAYEEMRKQIDAVAEQARAAGATWRAIAEAADMTPQSAHKRWGGKPGAA